MVSNLDYASLISLFLLKKKDKQEDMDHTIKYAARKNSKKNRTLKGCILFGKKWSLKNQFCRFILKSVWFNSFSTLNSAAVICGDIRCSLITSSVSKSCAIMSTENDSKRQIDAAVRHIASWKNWENFFFKEPCVHYGVYSWTIFTESGWFLHHLKELLKTLLKVDNLLFG